jgi:hypothetical protein
MTVSHAIGIDMPNDFPTDAHNVVVKKLSPYQPRNPDVWSELAAGWNAVAIRFKSAANADERYTVSIGSKDVFRSHDALFLQQDALFGFFINGYAALESFAYAVFAMGAMLLSSDFPMSTPTELRAISLKKTKSGFTTNFCGTDIEAALSALIDDPTFSQWSLIRNILAHRSEPPRYHYVSVGGGAPNRTVWEITGGIPIDDQTIASYRPWLATTLTGCIASAEAFVTTNFT